MIENRKPMALAGFLLVCAATSLLAEGELQFAELGDCPLESGAVIKDCRIAYRTLGQLDGDRANVMVVPTWYTGTSKNLIDSQYIGPGKIADTSRFHVIAVEALGNGISSSPSTSEAQPGRAFPGFNVGDMVSSQHRLLTEVLGLDRVRVVLGASMGGLQAWEWAIRHPDFMKYTVSIEGTPWPSSFDLMLWSSWLDALDVYDGSEATRELSSLLVAKLDGLTLWTPGHFNSMVPAGDYEKFMRGFAASRTSMEMLDRRSQTVAILAHDIRRNVPEFDLRAVELIRSRVMSVVFSQDHMVNPGPSVELARKIGAESVVLDTHCGHMGPNPECVQEQVASAVNRFLED